MLLREFCNFWQFFYDHFCPSSRISPSRLPPHGSSSHKVSVDLMQQQRRKRAVFGVFAQKCHHHRLTHKQACSTNKNSLFFCPYFLYLFLGSQIIALVVGKAFFIFIRVYCSLLFAFQSLYHPTSLSLWIIKLSCAPNLNRTRSSLFFMHIFCRWRTQSFFACTFCGGWTNLFDEKPSLQ